MIEQSAIHIYAKRLMGSPPDICGIVKDTKYHKKSYLRE